MRDVAAIAEVSAKTVSRVFNGDPHVSPGDLAMANHMSVVITSLGQDPAYERDKEIVEPLLRQSISGLIIAPSATDHAYLQTWSSRLPIVFVDRPPVRVAADSFTEGDHGGGYEATQHLILHGHRRVAFIGDTLDLPTRKNRLAGYRAVERG